MMASNQENIGPSQLIQGARIAKSSLGKAVVDQIVDDEPEDLYINSGDDEHSDEGENDSESPDIFVKCQKVGFELKVGMIANSDEEAFDLYNKYAYEKGFSIRKSHVSYKKGTQIKTRRQFCCSKEGYKDDDPTLVEKQRKKLQTRCGCLASVVFKVENGAYEIIRIVTEHNHPLVKPKHRHLLRSSRKVTDTAGNVLKSMADAGIRATKSYSYMVKQASGVQNVGFTIGDCHNFLQGHRLNTIAAGDSQSLLNHFKLMCVKDPMFFYTMQVDSESRMTNFFWRDGSSKVDYECFGDVVVFDTTYRTNKYNMICAPFVGVDHHWRNVLFGCAFLLDETISSFVWVFETFLESMGGKAPKTLFTDQDQAMSNAAQKVFPNAKHRLCVWHISKNATQHISHLLAKPKFKALFSKVLHDCETEHDFETTWKEMVDNCGGVGNKWLEKLYTLRHKWSPAFSLDTFSAGMRSTQRSESTNNVFQHMACKTMSLMEFVKHFEDNADKLREAERSEDYNCANGMPYIILPSSGLLKHAASVYTHKLFGMFQHEFLQGVTEEVVRQDFIGTLSSYKLKREGCNRVHNVCFNSIDSTVACDCKKLESMGLLCCHALRVLNILCINNIPSHYVLKRWTKDAKDGKDVDGPAISSRNTLKSSKTFLQNKLIRRAVFVMNLSADDETTVKIAEKNLDRTVKEVTLYKAKLHVNANSNRISLGSKTDGHCSDGAIRVLDPPRIRTKGQTYARLKGALEKSKKKRKRQADVDINTQFSQTTLLTSNFHTNLPNSSQVFGDQSNYTLANFPQNDAS